MRSPLHFTSSRAVTLIEAVVGGALILLAGYLLNSSSAESVKMRKSLDENIIMRRILDYTAAEISRNGGIFLAMEHGSGSKLHLYYACYSDQGTLQANRQGDVEYGIFTAKKPSEDYDTAEQLTPQYLKEHKLGFAATKPLQPCEDSRYIAYALPIDLNGREITYLAHIWVYSLIAGEEIKSALADSAVITPI